LGALPAALRSRDGQELLAPLLYVPGDAPDVLAALPLAATPAPDDRGPLARGLAIANQRYGHPRAGELAALLADAKTLVVATGQQPGVLGGPLFTLTKALAATAWAERLTAAGRPAVAVFWMATEDHDWAESTRCAVWDGHQTLSLDLGEDPAPLTQLAMRTLGGNVAALLTAARESLPSAATQEAFDSLALAYRPEASFGEAFAALLVRLLGDRCPLLLDASSPAVKAAEEPWLRRLVERRSEVEAAIVGAETRIQDRGLSPQVTPQRGLAPFFVVSEHGARRRVVWETGERWSLRGAAGSWPVQELLDRIAGNTATVGPGVLSRPAIQDAILGTSIQVLGPGELAYMAQAAAVYEALEVRPSAVTLRPHLVSLEPAIAARARHWLEEPLRLLAADFSAEHEIAASAGEGAALSAARERCETALAQLWGAVEGLDSQLERPWQKTRDTVLRALDTFGEKLDGSTARRNATELARLTRLREALMPGGKPQERVLTLAPAAARWGPVWLQALQRLPMTSERLFFIDWEEVR